MFSEFPPSEETGLETFAFMGRGQGSLLGNVTLIEAGRREGGAGRLGGRKGLGLGMGLRARGAAGGVSQRESRENLYGLSGIGVKGEVSVVVDLVEHGLVRRDGVGTGARTEGSGTGIGSGSGSRDESNWDVGSRKSGKSFEMR